MSFSDWITIVSILIAVIFAVFKFEEREIIRLKNVWRFATVPMLLLLVSGVSAYFHSNSHPKFLNFLWVQGGLSSGVWPIIWLIITLTASIISWWLFVRQAPSGQLIELYVDLLRYADGTSFSTLIRKYERYLFEHVDKEEWLRYQDIFIIPRWWSIAPVHFRQVLANHPMRLFEMNREVLKVLIRVQFGGIQNTMMEELETLPYEGDMADKPMLRIFLGTRESIRRSRERNILIPTIKEVSFQYFSSLEFIEQDARILRLKPVDDQLKEAIPERLKVFYFIHFIHWYWIRAIHTRPAIAGFYQYEFWVEFILEQAPEIDENNLKGGHPNYYCVCVDRIFSNIGDWIDLIDQKEITDMKWATDHFIQLKLHILKKINDKYSKKVVGSWMISQITILMFDLLTCHRLYNGDFHPNTWLNDYKLTKDSFETAFTDLTDQEFVTGEEKAQAGYQWLLAIKNHY